MENQFICINFNNRKSWVWLIPGPPLSIYTQIRDKKPWDWDWVIFSLISLSPQIKVFQMMHSCKIKQNAWSYFRKHQSCIKIKNIKLTLPILWLEWEETWGILMINFLEVFLALSRVSKSFLICFDVSLFFPSRIAGSLIKEKVDIGSLTLYFLLEGQANENGSFSSWNFTFKLTPQTPLNKLCW